MQFKAYLLIIAMKKTLIWATRPSHQNGAWQQYLQQHFQNFDVVDDVGVVNDVAKKSVTHSAAQASATSSASVNGIVNIPLLTIEPVSSDNDKQAIKNQVLNLEHFAHIIFVSQNAVAHGFEWIENYWPQLPIGISFYAVGAKTAAAVQRYNVTVTQCGEAMNSEALLALPALQAVNDQKILIFRGKGGRPKLAVELEARGAQVRYCELYERLLPKAAMAQCRQIAQMNAQHIIPIFSGDTLSNLMQVLPATMNKNSITLVLPAERVATLARQLGFIHIYVAKNASEAAMLHAITLSAP